MKKQRFILQYLSFIILLIPLSIIPLLAQAQQPAFCTDMVKKANNLLAQKKYDEARTFCESALPLCPNAAADLQSVLRDIGKAIDAEKKAAVDAKKRAETNLTLANEQKGIATKALETVKTEQAKTVEALEKTQAAQAAELKSQAATQAALDKLKITANEAVTILIAEIDRNIMRLEYDSTFKKCETAVKLDAQHEEVKKRLLEIAYFYTEADTAEAAVKTLKLLTINALPNRTDLLAVIQKNAPPLYFDFLTERYYPKMIKVEGGTFTMKDDTLAYQVKVNDYEMAQTETTFFQYNLFAKATHHHIENPSWQFAGDNPAVNVSWYDAAFYLNWLSDRRSLKKVYELTNEKEGDYDVRIDERAKGYRLPTEAEWEFAARGGNKTHGFAYSGDSVLNNVAWNYENSNSRTHSVKTKKENELGLYDMTGNVWEWCNDWYSRRFTISSDKMWISPIEGVSRSLRGGSWVKYGTVNRVSDRYGNNAFDRDDCIGFRLVVGLQDK